MVCALFCVGESIIAWILVYYLGLPPIVAGSILGILFFSVGILTGFWINKFLKKKNEKISIFIGNVVFALAIIYFLFSGSQADIKISMGLIIGFFILSLLYSLKEMKILKIKNIYLGIFAIVLAILISFILQYIYG